MAMSEIVVPTSTSLGDRTEGAARRPGPSDPPQPRGATVSSSRFSTRRRTEEPPVTAYARCATVPSGSCPTIRPRSSAKTAGLPSVRSVAAMFVEAMTSATARSIAAFVMAASPLDSTPNAASQATGARRRGVSGRSSGATPGTSESGSKGVDGFACRPSRVTALSIGRGPTLAGAPSSQDADSSSPSSALDRRRGRTPRPATTPRCRSRCGPRVSASRGTAAHRSREPFQPRPSNHCL